MREPYHSRSRCEACVFMGTHVHEREEGWYDPPFVHVDVYLCMGGKHGSPWTPRYMQAIAITHNQSFVSPVPSARESVIEFVRDAVNACVPSPEERMTRIQTKFADMKHK